MRQPSDSKVLVYNASSVFATICVSMSSDRLHNATFVATRLVLITVFLERRNLRKLRKFEQIDDSDLFE